jgi:hypothetical protein
MVENQLIKTDVFCHAEPACRQAGVSEASHLKIFRFFLRHKGGVRMTKILLLN